MARFLHVRARSGRLVIATVLALPLSGVLWVGAPPAAAATSIMGPSVLTAGELAGWYAATGRTPHPDLGITIRQLAGHFIAEARAENVRGDIAFAQSILETGSFSFPAGGQVRPQHNNYAGIGAVDGGSTPNSFSTPQIGVRAQIQHLRAYADPTVTSTNLAFPLVDPRFQFVTKGVAPNWEDLSGRWATDPLYASKILTIYASMLEWADVVRNAVRITGDWNNDGTVTPGWYKDGLVRLRNANTSGASDVVFRYGRAGDVPVVGDWDGNGSDTIGVRRGATWLLRNSNTAGAAQLSFTYGKAADVPVVGNWDGIGGDTVGVRRGATWHLRNSSTAGAADLSFNYGSSGDVPVTGDWNNTGSDTVGVRRGAVWYLRNSNTAGPAQLTFTYGRAGDVPVTGNWNNSGGDTVGVVRGTVWYLRNANSAGPANLTASYQG